MKPYQINKVLVPIDFSDVSLNALETAIAICKRQLATLTVINVVEPNYTNFIPEAGVINSLDHPNLVKIAGQNLEGLAKKIRSIHDVVINHIVQSGNPANEICLWAQSHETDLIVMGTRGASKWKQFLLGSNAYSVVKNAPCPVMTIPGDSQWLEFRKILFPVRDVAYAIDKYSEVRPIIKQNAASILLAGIAKRNDPEGLKKVKRHLKQISDNLSEDDVICEGQVHLCEDVPNQLLAIAEIEKPDLMVITATLDSTLSDFIAGPYTQQVIGQASVPVLSIKPSLGKMPLNNSSPFANQLQQLQIG